VSQYLPITALLLVFLALAGLYNVVTPLGEGPDEPGHGQYVLFLAREGRLPVQCAAPCASDVPGSGHHPPLAYLLAAPLVSWLPHEERQIDLPGNRRFSWAGGDQPNAVGHGTREQWPWGRTVLAWHLARLASTLAGAATVLFTYLAARAVEGRLATPDGRLPLLAAALVALNPQFLFTSALISNDALLAALAAALLWLVVGSRRPTNDERRLSAVVDGDALGRAATIGLVLGLALITKQSAVLLVPIALAWGLASWRWDAFTSALARTGVIIGVAAAVSGWWYARNWRLYGDPLGLDLFRAEFTTQPFEPSSGGAWAGALAQLYASSWARFGWLNVAPPGWVDWFYALVGGGATLGLALAAVGALRARDERFVGRLWPVLALPALAFGWVLSFALTAGLVAWQGRLLFPALPALAILLAAGLVWWTKGRGRSPGESGGAARLNLSLVVCLGLLAAWLPFGVIRPAYPFQTLPEREALARVGTPMYGRFARTDERGAELRGWSLAGEARPGATLALGLMWHAVGERQNRDWVVFVHLEDATGEIVAETNREPTGGRYPMTQWVAGDWVPDRQTLELPPGIEPGAYRLRVGLWYPETGRRARVYADGGSLRGDSVELGTVTVTNQ
jgi:4-amino-4-deoxy-L-arabinose transferase-like glycosyltransferase